MHAQTTTHCAVMDNTPTKDTSAEDEFERAAEQFEAPLASLVGDHEEGVPGAPAARGVYLLPNALTTGALFCGFYAIVAGMQGNYLDGAMAIFAAMIFDGLDGRVARWTNTQSAFGAEYDSLADMVSFGVAPALLLFNWALLHAGKVGWVAAFLYTACAALRLARFNSQLGTTDNSHFVGLASPAAAALVAGAVWLGESRAWTVAESPQTWLLALFLSVVGVLMVARIRYYSFKTFRLEAKVPFARMFLFVGLLSLIALDPPAVLFGLFLIYTLSGPLQHFRQRQ